MARQRTGKDIRNAVISVPAYFNDSQKEATKIAAEIAGIDCRAIINEPTAAALCYGFGVQGGPEKKCVIFDFGGGTFDVSVLKITSSEVKVLAINGNTHLGGQDIDNAMMDHVLKEYQEEFGEDLSNNSRAKTKIRNAC